MSFKIKEEINDDSLNDKPEQIDSNTKQQIDSETGSAHSSPTRPNLRRVKEEKKSEIIQCGIKDCNKTFTSKNGLKNHMKKHSTDGLVHKCDLCQIYCVSDKELREHYKTHNGDGLKKTCEFCRKAFIKKAELKQHVKGCGKNPKRQIPCPSCPNKKFYGTENLLTHLHDFHSFEGGHVCDRCGSLFKEKSAWTEHRKTCK